MAQIKGIILFLFLTIINDISAINCYNCASNIGDLDQRCVTNASAVESGQKTMNCNAPYCTSKRVEYKDPVNVVKSMQRGCEKDPEKLNAIVEDDTYVTYYKACRYELCNDGDGKTNDGGGSSFVSDLNGNGVILVEGIGTGTTNIAVIANILAGIIALLLF